MLKIKSKNLSIYFITAVVMWIALSLSYNSCKEIIRFIYKEPLPGEIRDLIKANLKLPVILFELIFLIFSSIKGIDFNKLGSYKIVLILYALVINIIYMSNEPIVLIVQNLSLLYFVILLLLYLYISKKLVHIFIEYSIDKTILKYNLYINDIITRKRVKKLSNILIFSACFLWVSYAISYSVFRIADPGQQKSLLADITYFVFFSGVLLKIIVEWKEDNNGGI